MRLLSFFLPNKNKDYVFYEKLKNIIKYSPKNKIIFKKAFTHSSLNLKDDKGDPYNFERLEYLGDSVLSTVVASYLFQKLSNANEGELSRMKAKIVSRGSLNKIGGKMKLIDLLFCAENKENFGEDIHGNILESLIGAVFVDKGYLFSRKIIEIIILKPYVQLNTLTNSIVSFKSNLLEWSQKNKKNIVFETLEETRNERYINFYCNLYIDNILIVKVRDVSKKKTEEKASKQAFNILKIES